MKKMRTVMTLVLALLLVLSVVGCGKKEEAPEITIDQLYEQGYELNASGLAGDEGTWQAYYVKDGDWQTPYLVEIPMTQDEVSEIFEAETDEDAKAIICGKENITITDKSGDVPAEDTLNEYVGKSLADLEEDGFYEYSASEDEEGNVVVDYAKNGNIVIRLSLSEAMTFDEYYSEDVDHSQLIVETVTFAGFSID